MEIFCYDSRHYIKNIRLAMDKFDVAQNNEEVSKARQEVVDSVKELESNNDLHILLSLNTEETRRFKTCLKETGINLYSKIRLLNEKQRASTCWLF